MDLIFTKHYSHQTHETIFAMEQMDLSNGEGYGSPWRGAMLQ